MSMRARTHATVHELGGTSLRVQAWTLTVAFLIVLLDGLDTTSIAFVVPVLGRDWGLPAAAFTPAFVATSVGAVVGYMASGPLAERFGHRAIGILSVALFGVGTLLTAQASDVATLSLLRLVSAVGLGGALPIAITTASGVVPARRSTTAAMLAATGFSAGGVIGGLLGGPLMLRFGWTSVFVLGGVLPLLLLPAFARVLPRHADRARSAAAPFAALFREGLGLQTALLWLFAFLIFLAAYGLAFWIPTLLTELGFSPERAPLGAAAFALGGLVGSVLMVPIVGRLGIRPVLASTSLVAIGCVIALGFIIALGGATLPPGLVLLLITGIGAGLITGSVGQSALAVALYPAELRATGVGWAAAFGRIGSIVGPAVGGTMLSLGWPVHDIALTAVLPTAVAILALGAMGRVARRRVRTRQVAVG
jgi:AAHS family 4-hydroxybenzoate transporter-like MFS transporter